MRQEDHDLMHALETNFWWFVGMRRVTEALLRRSRAESPRNVLDVGCGTGINLLWIGWRFQPHRIVGCDYSGTAVNWCKETLASGTPRVPTELSRGDLRRLPFRGESFDLVISLDVLDVFPPGDVIMAASEIHRVLRPGGLAFVRAPAYQWLLSSHDILFETRHRFTTLELRNRLSGAGFEQIEATYANTILFPLALTERLLRKAAGVLSDKTDAQPWPKGLGWLNPVFKGCLLLEARLLALGWRLPFGLSAICIGHKPKSGPATAVRQ